MRRNIASQIIGAQMITASDGSAFTGTVTVYVTGDGGTQTLGSVGSGVCTHEGNGFHTYTPAQAETNYAHVGFTFIGTGAIPVTIQVYPVLYDANGRYEANLKAIEDQLTSGYNAILKLKELDIYNSGGLGLSIFGSSGGIQVQSDGANVIYVEPTGANGTAIRLDGIGTGYSLAAVQNIQVLDGVLTLANINAQVVDALNTDTYAEPGQGAPPATATLQQKIAYLYKFLRNRITQDATTFKVYNDDGTTVGQKATVSDNGSTFDRGEIESGP